GHGSGNPVRAGVFRAHHTPAVKNEQRAGKSAQPELIGAVLPCIAAGKDPVARPLGCTFRYRPLPVLRVCPGKISSTPASSSSVRWRRSVGLAERRYIRLQSIHVSNGDPSCILMGMVPASSRQDKIDPKKWI